MYFECIFQFHLMSFPKKLTKLVFAVHRFILHLLHEDLVFKLYTYLIIFVITVK